MSIYNRFCIYINKNKALANYIILYIHSWSQFSRLVRGARINFARAKAVTSPKKRKNGCCPARATTVKLHVQDRVACATICLHACAACFARAVLAINCTCKTLHNAKFFFAHADWAARAGAVHEQAPPKLFLLVQNLAFAAVHFSSFLLPLPE